MDFTLQTCNTVCYSSENIKDSMLSLVTMEVSFDYLEKLKHLTSSINYYKQMEILDGRKIRSEIFTNINQL